MKYFLFSILLASLFVSFKTNSKQRADNDMIKKYSPANTAQTLIRNFKSVLQGAWVDKEYMDELTRTKSPLLAFPKSGLTTMLIDTGFMGKDTLRFEVGWGNHEGGEMAIKFRPAHIKGAVMLYSPYSHDSGFVDSSGSELAYNITPKDTSLVLFVFDKNAKLISTTTYFKVLSNFKGHELGYATDMITNKRLVSGTYILTDTLNRLFKVSYANDGKVAGFRNFLTYQIENDFTTPPGNNLDQITFVAGDKNSSSYAFKIDKDTLNLYQTSYAKDSIDFILGKRVYKLVRQRSK